MIKNGKVVRLFFVKKGGRFCIGQLTAIVETYILAFDPAV